MSGFLVVTILIALAIVGLLLWVGVCDRRGTPERRTMGVDRKCIDDAGDEIMGAYGHRKGQDGRPR